MAESTQTDVSPRTEKTAEFVRDAIDGWEVSTSRNRGVNARDTIVVYSNEDVSVNSFSKARVINIVLQEVPSLKVDSTEDGNNAVRFCFQNEH